MSDNIYSVNYIEPTTMIFKDFSTRSRGKRGLVDPRDEGFESLWVFSLVKMEGQFHTGEHRTSMTDS